MNGIIQILSNFCLRE